MSYSDITRSPGEHTVDADVLFRRFRQDNLYDLRSSRYWRYEISEAS